MNIRRTVVTATLASALLLSTGTPVFADSATISPSFGSIVHGVTTITVSDVPEATAAVVLRRYGTEIDRDTAAPWQLTWDTVGQGGEVTVGVVDSAGRTRTYIPDYVVDNAGPEVWINWYDGTPGVVPRGDTSVSGNALDFSGVGLIEWWVDGALRSTGWDLFYDFGPRTRKTTIEIRAWDKNGNLTTATFPVTVDADAPKVASARPATGALLRGKSVTSTLLLSDVSRVSYATPMSYQTPSDMTSPYSGKFLLGKDGRQVLTWWVQDYWSNGGYVHQTVTVDNTRPVLKVTKAPKNGAKVKGTVRVSASAKDRNGVAKVQLLINGKVVATDARAGYAFSINTKKYGKKFTVRLRAYDRAGNVTVTTARVWRR